MKKYKFFLLMILCLSCFTLAACEQACVYEHGLDKFYLELSSSGLTDFMPESFMEKFEYLGGDFFYYGYDDFAHWEKGTERALLYLDYSEEVYCDAKACLSDEMNLDMEQDLVYGGFSFHVNLEHNQFPTFYTMVGYNDEKHRLMFIGFYAKVESYPEVEYALTDFGVFLETFFGEYYNFNDVAE